MLYHTQGITPNKYNYLYYPVECWLYLTLSLLMSYIYIYIYIYGVPCKARNFNVVYIWTYVWQR
jgi:hypothetical protein